MRKKLIGISLGVIVLLAVLYALVFPKKKVQPTGPEFQTITASKGPLLVMVSATGVLEPIYQVEVKSKASGLVIKMPVEEGYAVKKSDLLAELDQTEVMMDFEQAKANYDIAVARLAQVKKTAERQKDLFTKGLISEEQMDQSNLDLVSANSQLVSAKAAMTNAKIRLQDCVVTSPINGVVVTKGVEAGQIISSGINSVSGGTLIAVVADMADMLVRTSVDEVDIGSVQIGQTAGVTPDAFPEDHIQGTVLRIAPKGTVDQNVTTFEVVIKIPNRNNKLKAGMNCTVDLTVADKTDVLRLPVEAVISSSQIRRLKGMIPNLIMPKGGERNPASRAQLVLIENQGQIEAIPVKTGVRNIDFIEIVSGLEEGQKLRVPVLSQALASRQEDLEWIRRRAGGMMGQGRR